MARDAVPRFTPEQRGLLEAGLVQIVAEWEAREWVAAINAVLPTVAVAVEAAAERETRGREA
ncbi:hypothetical protein ACFWBX_09720 [Streptomyces sp. NPDC059991]|uniref:hypothetical protein n=1 Tax=Streptomyces sp. NPDC059991 TaxID=3347028 RepID=UPI0036857523